MIIFKKLSFANLLSVGNQPVTIDLDKCKTTLVHGLNGSGKSTILDALTYSLFGKSFRGVTLPQLVNTQNKKGLLVECEFSIGNNDYLVRRGVKPKVFEIFKNKEIIESKANDRDNQAFLEKSILKLTYKSFTQIVILGSSNFVPFMQLPAAGRRECVEDFLDIKVFSTMAIMAKERLRGLLEQQRVLDAELSALEFKLEVQQEKIVDIEKRDVKEIETLQNAISEHDAEILHREEKLGKMYKQVTVLTEELDDAQRLNADAQVRQLNNVLIKMNAKLERLVKEKEFYDTNGSCHTCKQPIGYEHAEIQKAELQKEMDEVDAGSIKAASMLTKQQSVVDHVTDLNQKMTKLNRDLFSLQTEIKSFNDSILRGKRAIAGLKADTASIEKEQGVLIEMERELGVMQARRDTLIAEVSSHDVVASLLKDSGIKTQVVRRYLPAMNKFIRNYLGLLDLPIHFQLDEEFNENVRSPLHQDFTYASFSEGQKGRIDLALMLTWREIGTLKNSVSTNLLILDEVFSSSLDETGKDCLFALLRYRLPDSQRIVVVDHTLSSAFRDKFDHTLEVTRTSGFSRYD